MCGWNTLVSHLKLQQFLEIHRKSALKTILDNGIIGSFLSGESFEFCLKIELSDEYAEHSVDAAEHAAFHPSGKEPFTVGLQELARNQFWFFSEAMKRGARWRRAKTCGISSRSC